MEEQLAYLHQTGLHSLIFLHFDATYRTVPHRFYQLLLPASNICFPSVSFLWHQKITLWYIVHCGVQQSERIAS